MPKVARELGALDVKRIDAPGFHPVGGVAGLALHVTKSGARSWILRAKVGDRRRDIGLGGYPDVPLAMARDKARQLREQIREGKDPIAERKSAHERLRAAQARSLTFEQAARRCHAAKAPEFRNAKHRRDWISSLEHHAFPEIGQMEVSEVGFSEVLRVVERIWFSRTETATRVRQRLESTITWATVSGYRQGENPARWAGNLEAALPAPKKIVKVKHQRALPWQEMPRFIEELRAREAITARALEFAALTAARSGEVRYARWCEIDLEACVWIVPADRIKAGRRHRVPLSDDVLTLLHALPQPSDEEACVFPAPRGGPLSDMALSALCKRMKVAMTPHGVRASFKDFARNRTAFADEVSELALAHVNSDATRAAYARDGLLPQRAKLMQQWAQFLREGDAGGDVVPLRSTTQDAGGY